jgi:hypothetical protein
MGYPMGEGVGLSGTGSSNDKQWRRSQSAGGAMFDSPPLLGVEGVEVGGSSLHRMYVLG